jgi:NMD protein affecting ribosome stability and mRNA decay
MIRPCVRCGRAPRAGETFLCQRCLEDPRTRREVELAERDAPQYGDPRRAVIARAHWAGGWGRDA